MLDIQAPRSPAVRRHLVRRHLDWSACLRSYSLGILVHIRATFPKCILESPDTVSQLGSMQKAVSMTKQKGSRHSVSEYVEIIFACFNCWRNRQNAGP